VALNEQMPQSHQHHTHASRDFEEDKPSSRDAYAKGVNTQQRNIQDHVK